MVLPFLNGKGTLYLGNAVHILWYIISCAIQQIPQIRKPNSREQDWKTSWRGRRVGWSSAYWYCGAFRNSYLNLYLLNYACVGIHPRWYEPVSPIKMTLQFRWSCASSLETSTLSFSPLVRSRWFALPMSSAGLYFMCAKLRYGVGRGRPMIKSPLGRLAIFGENPYKPGCS